MKTTVRIHPTFALVPSRRHILCLAVLAMFVGTALAGAAHPGAAVGRSGPAVPSGCFSMDLPDTILTRSGDINNFTNPYPPYLQGVPNFPGTYWLGQKPTDQDWNDLWVQRHSTTP